MKSLKKIILTNKSTLIGISLFGIYLKKKFKFFEAKEEEKEKKITKNLFNVEKESLSNLIERISRFHKKSSNIIEIKKIFQWISSILEDYPVHINIIEESNFPSMFEN